MPKEKITIVGAGYVGMSLAVLLSQHHEVVVLDINKARVASINSKKSTIKDDLIDEYLNNKKLDLYSTDNSKEAFENSKYIVIATPTDYDVEKKYFDTSSIEVVIDQINKYNKLALIVIKSTIPIGYTKKLCEKYNTDRIVFSPEFLREGSALYDNLHPSRIIIGSTKDQAKTFLNILKDASLNKNVQALTMDSVEAESVKLFANSYLALRVAFFNELDSFAFQNNLSSKDIIDGVSLDNRIGDYYNNPSFGYGGYCLPKDTQQLLSNFDGVPQNIIEAIVKSNQTRKDFIYNKIKQSKPNTIGLYRLVMKANSDNFRFSSIQDVAEKLQNEGHTIIVYEPTIQDYKTELGYRLINDLKDFKNTADIILANRVDSSLDDVSEKTFSRDLYGNN